MRAALYARVSTHDKGQDPNVQLKPLREYCKQRGFEVAGEFVDVGVSGSKDRRPELDRLMDMARKRKINCLLVWKLDRFGRSLKNLINQLSELEGLNVAFISLQENLDFTTPTGRLLFGIVGAMAEFERSLIVERVKAGIVNARSKGKQIGRKPIDPISIGKMIELRAKNLSYEKISKELKLSVGLIHKTLRKTETKSV
jgi:DNA invertase Pin-like site-specific DNA recombinase